MSIHGNILTYTHIRERRIPIPRTECERRPERTKKGRKNKKKLQQNYVDVG